MIPAMRERDCRKFGEALYDFNARVGDAFTPAQGGRYAHAAVAEVVAGLPRAGVPGVGQSSWGPAGVAGGGRAERATHTATAARKRQGADMMGWWASARPEPGG